MKSLKILFIILITTVILAAQENDDKIVIGKRVTIKSENLNEEREIFIHLPNGYEQGYYNYPVFYVLDGDGHFRYLSGIVSYLSGVGKIPPMIVVGIPNTIRQRDFTPTKSEEIPNSGGADNFTSFLKDELIPYIDENYRTEKFRIIFGHSATAMYSLYLFINNPDLFDAYIAASPYLMYDDNYVVNLAKEKVKNSYEKNEFVYYTIGNEPDYFEILDEFTGIFKDKSAEKVEWKYEKMPKDDHALIPLSTVKEGFSFIYVDWKIPDNFPEEGTLSSLKYHYENLSNKYGYNVRIPEAQANILGYQVMALGRIEQAIKIFKYNVEMYPESANVYDSLGEGLETANKPEEAKKYYELAYKISTENNDPNMNIFKQHLDNIQKKISNN